MKKIFLLTAAMLFSACLFAQGVTGRGASEDITDAETFEAEKTKTEIIIPKDFHSTDTSASVKIEYSPMYDEVRIYYETMYVTYDRGEAMNAVLECLDDFRVEHKYNVYRYLKDDKEKFFKDDRGRRKAQYNSYVKFYR
jgi:predicted small secreted protein